MPPWRSDELRRAMACATPSAALQRMIYGLPNFSDQRRVGPIEPLEPPFVVVLGRTGETGTYNCVTIVAAPMSQ